LEDRQREGAVTLSHKCVHVRAEACAQILERLLADGRGPRTKGAPAPAVSIVSDPRTNSLLLRGPAGLIARAREILGQIDVAVPGQPPLVLGPPLLKTYTVAADRAEALARALQTIYRDNAQVKVVVVSPSLLAVWGTPEDHLAIARHLQTALPA